MVIRSTAIATFLATCLSVAAAADQPGKKHASLKAPLERLNIDDSTIRKAAAETLETKSQVAFAGLHEGDTASRAAVDRDANKSGLRYTVEVHSIRDQPGALPAPEPSAPEIELNGSLSMTAKLHNDGDQPVRVFWGDYAYPKMYRFDVTHESGWKPAITRYWPDEHLPLAGREKYFVVIQPGQFATYNLLLTPDPGANCEHCYLNRPGRYVIAPSLRVATHQVLDDQTGETRDVPDAWTGRLQAQPFSITIKGDPTLLDEGGRIGGTVVDAAGKAVSHALVTVRHRVANGPRSAINGQFREVELAQDATDADGRFEFFRLPAESPSFELDIRHVEHPPRHDVVFNNAPPHARQRMYDAKVTLDAGRTVRGRVVASQGKPLADVQLTVYRFPESYTDEQGRFTLTGLSAQVSEKMHVWRRGFIDRALELPAVEDANQEWIVTLQQNSQQTISGKAAFIGGERLRNMELAFAAEALEKPADSPPLQARVFSTKTDEEGRFKMVLSEPVAYEVKSVTAYGPGERHSARRVWQTTLEKLKPLQPDVDLVFDDTHKLVAEVRPVRPLPETYSLAVRCVFADERQTVEEMKLKHDGGKVEFNRLSPGNYYVKVDLMPHRTLSTASETIEIGRRPAGDKLDAESADARLLINFPELRFGRLIAEVVTPDGEPAPRATIRYEGPGSLGVGELDRDARFRLDAVPVGKVWISAKLPEHDDGRAVAEIREGRTEVVQVVVTPLVDVMGTVAGRIVYDDGSPARGASVDENDPDSVAEDGSYKVEVRSDQSKFRINLTNADGWPRFDRNRRLTSPWHGGIFTESLQVSMPVEPGKTNPRDIVLDRTRVGRLTLNWKKPAQQAQLTMFVNPFKDARQAKVPAKDAPALDAGEALDERLEFTRSMSVKLEENGKIVISDLPWGRRTVLLTTSQPYQIRFRTIPPDQADAVLTFDKNDEGRLRFRLLDDTGISKLESGFALSVALPGRPKQFVAFWSSPDPNANRESGENLPKNPYLQADGWFEVSPLDAARYELVVRDGARSKTLAVEVKPRETTSVEVRYDELKTAPPEQP